MVNVFTVVGEHKSDPRRLLVLGTDGCYYDYFPARAQFVPVDPDSHWTVYAHKGVYASKRATIEARLVGSDGNDRYR